jgi:hypothetical protein
MPSLRLHPDFSCPAITHIEVNISRPRADLLILSYALMGKINDIRMPPVAKPKRSHDLWLHTCFEAFVRPASGSGYYEFNFAPSTKWAAYRFDSYRTGRRAVDEISKVQIAAQSAGGRYTLQASLELGRLSGFSPDVVWHLGLSAVIEDAGGAKSYWALRHPSGKPDFHSADCFAHELSPAA